MPSKNPFQNLYRELPAILADAGIRNRKQAAALTRFARLVLLCAYWKRDDEEISSDYFHISNAIEEGVAETDDDLRLERASAGVIVGN